MTKNILAVAIAAALTVPFAAANASSHGGKSEAQAPEISFGGSARYRFASTTSDNGTNLTNIDGHDSRVRVNMTAKLDGGIKVYTQFENDTDRNGSEDTRVDQAYMVVPMGPVTLTAGDQKATWGNGFLVNSDKKPNRIKLGMKINKTTSIGIFSDPTTDTNTLDNGDTNTGGQRAGITAVTSMGGFKMGALYRPVVETVDVFADGMLEASHTMIKFEYASVKPGDDATTGLFLQVAQPLSESLVAFGAYINTTKGFKANDDFGPLSIVGSGANKTAANGAFARWGLTGGDTTGMIIGAILPNAGDMGMDVTVALGTATASTGTTTDTAMDDMDIDVSVMDLQVSKKVAKNATLKASYGTYTMTPDMVGAKDMVYTAAGLAIYTKF